LYRQQGIDHKNTTGTIWLVGGLILTNIFWGASGVAVKVEQLQLDIWEIIALRFFVATPLLIAFSVAWKGWKVFAVAKKDIPYLVALSIIGIPLEFFLQVTALARTSAMDYILIYNLSTIFIVFFLLS
jgi:drug/metabolite transporter (DMT)-like permease